MGDRSIKIIQLSNNYKPGVFHYSLEHASTLNLPEGLIVNGEIKQPEEVIKLLREHLARKKVNLSRVPWVVACLPETKTYIQLVKIKTTSHEEKITEKEIMEIAPSYLPYELNDIYFDWQEIPELSEKMDRAVILAGAQKKIIDPYFYLLNIAGLIPLAFEVEAASIARSVINRRKDLSEQSRGILDFGATRSSLIIFDHGTIQFSLSLPISGLQLTERLQTAFNMDFEGAEKIKKEYGLLEGKAEKKVKLTLEKILEDLVENISKAVQYYKLHFPERHSLTGIRLCGGGSNLLGLENFLSSRLKLKVRKANPWVNIFPKNKEPMDVEKSIHYTTATGLALRALEDPIIL